MKEEEKMLQYIKADLFRLRHKRANYIFWASIYAIFILFTVLGFSTFDSSGEMGFAEPYFQTGIFSLTQFGVLIIGVHSYYTVFLDDVSSKNYPNIFSTGLTKAQFMVAKMITLFIQLLVVFLASALVFFGFYGILALFANSIGFNSELLYFVFMTAITVLLAIMGYAAIGSIITFWSQNSTLSAFFIVILSTRTISQIIGLIASIDALSFLQNIQEYTLSSYISSTLNSITTRITFLEEAQEMSFMSVFGETWLVSLLYMMIASILCILLLKKIEIKENN